jgi:GNAT superfamily N-acetyltransferase
MIKLAEFKDLQNISDLAVKVRDNMKSQGLQQWPGDYPNYNNFLSDYNNKGLYIYLEDNEIIASITILHENEKPYRELKWHREKAIVIHRILVDPLKQKKGIGKRLFEFAINLGKENNYQSIKVDTHPDNIKMQNLIKKMGFEYIGFLQSIYRMAFELVIE